MINSITLILQPAETPEKGELKAYKRSANYLATIRFTNPYNQK